MEKTTRAGKSSKKARVALDDEEDDFRAESHEEMKYTTRSGRNTTRMVIKESDTDGELDNNLFANDDNVTTVSREKSRRKLSKGRVASVHDSELIDLHAAGSVGGRITRSRSKKEGSATASASPPQEDGIVPVTNGRSDLAHSIHNTRSQSQKRRLSDDQYDPEQDENESADADGDEEMDVVPSSDSRSPSPLPQQRGSRRRSGEMEMDIEVDQTRGDGKGTYMFRSRKNVDYSIPPPLGDTELRELANAGSATRKGGPKSKGRVGWSINGTELGRYMGLPGPGDDSVS